MPKSTTERRIHSDIQEIERRLKPTVIEDIDLKLEVLEKLSKILSDDVGKVLSDICDDLAIITGADAN